MREQLNEVLSSLRLPPPFLLSLSTRLTRSRSLFWSSLPGPRPSLHWSRSFSRAPECSRPLVQKQCWAQPETMLGQALGANALRGS